MQSLPLIIIYEANKLHYSGSQSVLVSNVSQIRWRNVTLGTSTEGIRGKIKKMTMERGALNCSDLGAANRLRRSAATPVVSPLTGSFFSSRNSEVCDLMMVIWKSLV
jgi:cell division protein FtsL